MPETKYTELDFAKIKENLKKFLKSQDRFKDYNFDGAGISILLDLLAYNTAYNGFYLNMLASEMFLDSAIQRDSVVSRAKHLGYTPRSARSAIAKVDIEIFPSSGPGPTAPANILIPISQTFYTIVDSKQYFFSPKAPVLIQPVDGLYKASDVELIEGVRLTHRWTYDASASPRQRFIIPNANIDSTQIQVNVQDAETSSGKRFFKLYKDLTEVTSESQVYFLQETNDNKYEIVFGDGIIGERLEDGNVIIVDYLVSTTDKAVGAKKFLPVTKIGGYAQATITTVEPAKNPSEQESIESIKRLAPLTYDAQNRAVTRLDYETLIKKDVPSVEYLRVWGGEDNEPPQYGRVFVSLKPFAGTTLSEDAKAELINTYIRPRNPISIEVIIVEPDYMRIKVDTTVLYRSSNTTSSAAEIQTEVFSAIQEFRASQLNGFDADFRYSKFIASIDSADESIEGNTTVINLKYRIEPPFNVPTKYEIKLNNAISKGDAANAESSINSSAFIYKGVITFVGDNGKGSLYLYRIVNDQKVIIQADIGSVNYADGVIILDAFLVQSIPNGLDFVDFTVELENFDINSLRNQILLLEDEDISIAIKDLSVSQ